MSNRPEEFTNETVYKPRPKMRCGSKIIITFFSLVLILTFVFTFNKIIQYDKEIMKYLFTGSIAGVAMLFTATFITPVTDDYKVAEVILVGTVYCSLLYFIAQNSFLKNFFFLASITCFPTSLLILLYNKHSRMKEFLGIEGVYIVIPLAFLFFLLALF